MVWQPKLCPSSHTNCFGRLSPDRGGARRASNEGSKTRVGEPSDNHEATYVSRQIVRSGRSACNPSNCGRKRAGISVAQPHAAMEAHVPRSQVRLMAVMVILMWWSYIQWIRPVMLPSRHEQRLVFPPGALDPHNTYRHLLFPRARQEPADRMPSAVPTRQTGQVA